MSETYPIDTRVRLRYDKISSLKGTVVGISEGKGEWADLHYILWDGQDTRSGMYMKGELKPL